MYQEITNVITPAVDTLLTTVARFQAISRIAVASGDEIAFDMMLQQASAAIAQFTNRTLAQETVEESFFPARDAYPYQLPGGMSDLMLTRWPVSSVASVVVGPDDSSQELTLGTDFLVRKASGKLVRLGSGGYPVPWLPVKTVVTYTAGYTLPGWPLPSGSVATLPADIEDACIRLLTGRAQNRDRDPLLKSENIPDVGERVYWIPATATGNISPEIADLLDNYRVPVTG